MADPEPGATVYLVGFMGCGKSTVGRLLADAAGLELIDSDRLIESETGTTIPRLIAERGEAGFRAIELELFGRAIVGRRAVVATGGGLPLSRAARSAMRRSGRSLWLDLPLAGCAARVGAAGSRPLWPADDPLSLRALYERRAAVYALCDARIDASGEPAAVAARALAAIRGGRGRERQH